MFSVTDFVSKYNNYTGEELLEIHSNLSGYSAESQEAVNIVIQTRGGMENLLEKREEKNIIEAEINRIKKETEIMGSQHIDASFINTVTTSAILSPEKIKEIIDKKHAEVELELDDKKIKPRTITMSIVGGAIASVVGGVLWGLQMIYAKAIFTILFVGLILFCYGIIRIATKQSYKNTVVIIATTISVILAGLIGNYLYALTGYRG